MTLVFRFGLAFFSFDLCQCLIKADLCGGSRLRMDGNAGGKRQFELSILLLERSSGFARVALRVRVRGFSLCLCIVAAILDRLPGALFQRFG